MSLSPELQAYQDREQAYNGSEATRLQLNEKQLHEIVAPTAMGKSAISDAVIKQVASNEWAIAGSIMTRPGRRDDLPNYIADVPMSEMLQRIDAGEMVNYSVHPGGDVYAYAPESFPGIYNLAPTLPSSIPALDRAGFTEVKKSFIVASAEDWQTWLGTRINDPKIVGRMQEAITSLEFGIEHKDEFHFVENSSHPDGLQKAAQKVIDITLGKIDLNTDKTRELELLDEMLEFARGIAA